MRVQARVPAQLGFSTVLMRPMREYTPTAIFCPQTSEHPSGAAIKSYIETVILLATLLFAFSTAYFGSFGREDLQSADADWVSWCNDTNFRNVEYVKNRGWCDGFDVDNWHAWPYIPSRDLGNRVLCAPLMMFTRSCAVAHVHPFMCRHV